MTDLQLPPVQHGEQEWLSAASKLLDVKAEPARARLLLATLIAAHGNSLEAYWMHSRACLLTDNAPEALQVARCDPGALAWRAMRAPSHRVRGRAPALRCAGAAWTRRPPAARRRISSACAWRWPWHWAMSPAPQ